jgi:hypothetical protein
MEEHVIREEVVIDATSSYLVQYYEHADADAKASCLAYLSDCGHVITCTPRAVVGHGDEPAISWGDLSDLIEPRDD